MKKYTEFTIEQALRKVTAQSLCRVKRQIKMEHHQKMLRLSAVKHYISGVTIHSEHQLAKSLDHYSELLTLSPCHLHHVDNMCMPVSVDNIPEYKDPQAHSASECNISFLPVAKHVLLSLFSGDL